MNNQNNLARLFLLVTTSVVAISITVNAQLPVPHLRSVFPAGAKQGTTVDVELGEGNLSVLGANGLVLSVAEQALVASHISRLTAAQKAKIIVQGQ